MSKRVTFTHICCKCWERTIRYTCPCGHRYCLDCREPEPRRRTPLPSDAANSNPFKQ